MLGEYDLEKLLDSVAWQETRNNHYAVSPKGARTKYGIMPATASDPGYGIRGTNINNLMADEASARDFSRQYLKAMYERTGDVGAALAAYNGGLGRGLNYKRGGWVPDETKKYVPSVLAHYNQGASAKPMTVGTPNESAPTMSGIPSMNVPQPQFPGLDLNGAIDPTKLTPIQLAMLQAQGAHGIHAGGLMGPGTGDGRRSNPMQLAMGQGDPSMMGPTGPVPPMAQAMMVGPAGAGGPVMDMAEDGPTTTPKGNWFQRNGEKVGDALMGVGASLQSIDNPQGAAALIGLLRTKKDGKLTAEDLIRLSQGERRLAQGDRSLDIKDAAAKAKIEEKEQPKIQARTSMSGMVKDMANRYLKLDELGGIVNPDKPQKDNAKAWMGGTQIGQGVGKMMGTEAQSIREGINNVRPLLMQAIRKASEAGVRSLDSDKELQFYMSSVSDPGTGDLYSNLAALERLDEHFGLGVGLKETLPPDVYARVKGQAENYKTAKPWESGASTTPSTDTVIDFDDWKRGG
jgi:hypothetical protein